MSTQDKFFYKAFGLNLESDFILNGLFPSDGPTQVRIIEGEVSVKFPGPIGENAYWSEGKDKFAFRIIGVGAFLINSGSEITIQSDTQMPDDRRALYILGTCMGALLLQRGLIPMHGSALSLNNNEVIFTGNSGAGKSTLTASLIKRGYSFLADDISALQVKENGDAWIIPAFPKQKLCGDAATIIFGGLDGLERIKGIRDKYHVPSSDQFITESRKLCALFELATHAGSEVELEEVVGTEKLAVIIRNTYKLLLIEAKGIEAEHFQQCSKIAATIKVYKLKRPMSGFTIEEQINKIMMVLE